MKLNKTVLASVLGLSVASYCGAGTIYMTGSTAMRGTVFTTMTTAGVVFTGVPTTTLFGGGGSSANYMAFSGTLVGGSGTTLIQCHWSGSEAGVADVATPRTSTFIDPSLLDGTDHGTNNPSVTASGTVDLAMADNSQSFSRTKTPVLGHGGQVGIITFKWVRNPGVWTGANVSDSQIRQALNGTAPLAVFTGNAADTGSFVYVSGRDNQSGTRVNSFGETGWGIFISPNQIEVDGTGNMVNLDGLGTYIGDFGFSSGGTLAGTLGTSTVGKDDNAQPIPLPGAGFSVIAYLSVGDAGTAIGKGAVELTLDGVTFSPAAVKEGNYDFWGNEYIYINNTSFGAAGEAKAAFTLLSASTGINNFCDGVKAIKLGDMHCTRNGPTSDPAHN
jgi:hypothetical protein